MQISIANVTITSEADLKNVPTADLLEFYNDAANKSTSKFASREKGEQQVWKIIKEDVEAAAPVAEVVTEEVAPTKTKVKKAKPAKDESEGRKVRVKEARKIMKGDRPKDTSEDGKVLAALEAVEGVTTVEAVAASLGRTDRQVRNSLSYLRRKYGVEIVALNSQEIKLG